MMNAEGRYRKVEKLILKLAWTHSTNRDQLEEMIAIGNLAFVKAMKKFNGNEKTWSVFMYRAIKNAMVDAMRRSKYQRDNCFIGEGEFKCDMDVRRYKFLDLLVSEISHFTLFMLKDLFTDPTVLFRQSKYGGRKYLKAAFKQVMADYGYDPLDIACACDELTKFIKGGIK